MKRYSLEGAGYILRVTPASEWAAKLADASNEKNG